MFRKPRKPASQRFELARIHAAALSGMLFLSAEDETAFCKEFWRRVDVNNHGCWNFKGYTTKRGYGRISVPRRWQGYLPKAMAAHRLAYLLARGDITESSMVLHTCDNPPCCRPDHLYLGSYLENAQDRVFRGRHVALRGEENGSAKLTEAAVLEIKRKLRNYNPKKVRTYSSFDRERPLTLAGVAREFGVSVNTVTNIHKGKTWTHVKPD